MATPVMFRVCSSDRDEVGGGNHIREGDVFALFPTHGRLSEWGPDGESVNEEDDDIDVGDFVGANLPDEDARYSTYVGFERCFEASRAATPKEYAPLLKLLNAEADHAPCDARTEEMVALAERARAETHLAEARQLIVSGLSYSDEMSVQEFAHWITLVQRTVQDAQGHVDHLVADPEEDDSGQPPTQPTGRRAIDL